MLNGKISSEYVQIYMGIKQVTLSWDDTARRFQDGLSKNYQDVSRILNNYF